MTPDNRRINLQEELDLSRSSWEEGEALLSLGHTRGALTRYYYSAFHTARAALLSRGIEPRTHEGVISEFNRHFVKTKLLDPAIARIISYLQKDREEADYSRAITFSEHDARGAQGSCRAFLDAVHDVLKREGWV
jgi:uncharacterized protein (UPF0332 family)